ncbi:MAG: DUF1295 domain-containing protein [Gammaproteobacteria bacterium]|nr:DUF1295 domain-containing protein [Gammaproteobacteria bacterium]MDH3465167.1 DUF1295 domain-containing protein [Gammaproteobacteria bacterium]
MFDLVAWFWALAALLVFALMSWLISLVKHDVSIVDSLWSLMFLLATTMYIWLCTDIGTRLSLVSVLLLIWSLRLCIHITWRNWGEAEDPRYQAIRRNNEPNFEYKSLYIVFGLQAVLAWLIATPLLVAVSGSNPVGPWDIAGIGFWIVGMIFQGVGDWQLARFKSEPGNSGKVMDRGLWRYTRHPNYFGEACVWWGFYLIAVGGGGWWTIFAPVLITFLLLKVSGVALLEKDIDERRPAYRQYRERTNAFIPGPPKPPAKTHSETA